MRWKSGGFSWKYCSVEVLLFIKKKKNYSFLDFKKWNSTDELCIPILMSVGRWNKSLLHQTDSLFFCQDFDELFFFRKWILNATILAQKTQWGWEVEASQIAGKFSSLCIVCLSSSSHSHILSSWTSTVCSFGASVVFEIQYVPRLSSLVLVHIRLQQPVEIPPSLYY